MVEVEKYCLSFNTPFGWLTLEATSKGLKRVRFDKFCRVTHLPPNSSTMEYLVLGAAQNGILEYLNGKQVTFSHPIDVSFTTLQFKVFNEVSKIPYGETISYKELSIRVGTSPRACGQILASNPLPIIIPCHRVIRATGGIGGFSGGITWKEVLLKLEKTKV